MTTSSAHPLHVLPPLYDAAAKVSQGIEHRLDGAKVFLHPIAVIPPPHFVGQHEFPQESPRRPVLGQTLLQQMAVGLLTDVQPQRVVIIFLKIPHAHFPDHRSIIHQFKLRIAERIAVLLHKRDLPFELRCQPDPEQRARWPSVFGPSWRYDP